MTNSSSSPVSRAALPIVLIVILAGAVAYIIHLRGQLAEPQRGGGAKSAAAPDAGAVQGEVLTAEQADAIGAVLKTDTGSGRTAWFQIEQNNAATGAFQAALGRVFTDAGWTVKTVRSPYGFKPGVFLMAADENPPEFVVTVKDALNAAGWDVRYLTGYRAFFKSKVNDPEWHGPELTDDQSFVIVIGSRPALKGTSAE